MSETDMVPACFKLRFSGGDRKSVNTHMITYNHVGKNTVNMAWEWGGRKEQKNNLRPEGGKL